MNNVYTNYKYAVFYKKPDNKREVTIYEVVISKEYYKILLHVNYNENNKNSSISNNYIYLKTKTEVMKLSHHLSGIIQSEDFHSYAKINESESLNKIIEILREKIISLPFNTKLLYKRNPAYSKQEDGNYVKLKIKYNIKQDKYMVKARKYLNI